MHIALVGTRGIPARYGGFETAIEEVGRRLAQTGHKITVYCRSGQKGPATYLGMKLVWLPALKVRAVETVSHTALSVAHLVAGNKPDAVFVFNAANAPFVPALKLRGLPVATHMDGMEWQRPKWGKLGRRYYRVVERMAVRWSDALIADAEGIADYYSAEFGVPTELITFGAPAVERREHPGLAQLGLTPDGYHLVVARMEPENHVDVIVRGFTASSATRPMIVVGSAPYAGQYIAKVRAAADQRVRFLGSVWDQELLDQLYANALVYWHGHSVGGTNPSLLRALGAGTPVNGWDITFNHEVAKDAGRYFHTAGEVARLAELTERNAADTASRRVLASKRARAYDWDDVAAAYENLAARLASREVNGNGSGGRRIGTWRDTGARTRRVGVWPAPVATGETSATAPPPADEPETRF